MMRDPFCWPPGRRSRWRWRWYGAPPPWWPAGEPWPPVDPGAVMRQQFFRRAMGVGVVMMAFAAWGVATLGVLASLLFSGYQSARAIGAFAGIVAGAAVAVASFVLFVVVRRVGRPLRRVMEAADRVAAGDYATRVDERGSPSIRSLARAFNAMTERLQRHDRLRRDLMADIAHELRTPLTVIHGRLEGLLDGVYPRDDRHLGEILEETRVLSRLIDDLRTLALSESGGLKLQKEPTDAAALARDVIRGFTPDADTAGVRLRVETAGGVAPIDLDPVRIRQVLANLLSNALRYTPSGGSVTLRVAAAPGGGIEVAVADTGSGMTAEEVARAFDRFHKGGQSRGSGLGLAIARGLVSAHGGEMRLTSEPGRGTTVQFSIPNS